MRNLVILGPQRFRPSLRATLQEIDVHGSIGVVTAGWQEREDEIDELREHLGSEVQNLQLYQRYERVLHDDPDLGQALQERQQELRQIQQLYRVQLAHALGAARELMARQDAGAHLDDHRRSAIRALRSLDRQHVIRVRRVHERFERRWMPSERPAVVRQRERLGIMLESCAALAVAGGHVAVLLNRMRLFDPIALIDDRPVIAWSAGAMALADRVVLFHDSPPQGAGNAEVLDAGLGVLPRVVPLPHARRRLRLADPVRVALFARRFAPSTCALLDADARLEWNGQAWQGTAATRRLMIGGTVRRFARA